MKDSIHPSQPNQVAASAQIPGDSAAHPAIGWQVEKLGKWSGLIGSRLSRRGWRTVSRNRRGLSGLLILAAIATAAIAAPLLTPYAPLAQDLSNAHKPPFWIAGGSPAHPLGTDYIGRDVLTRVIYGARVSLLVGLGGVLIASSVGTTLGLLAGYVGGWVDGVIARAADAILSIPWILFVVFIVAILGSSLLNVILIFGIMDVPLFTRAVRGEVLTLKGQQFVEAAVSIGARRTRIIGLHLLPNTIGTVITLATFELATMILWEAGLGFLGLSVPPTIPSWGNMMADGRSYLRSDWWLATFPGLAVTLCSLGVNLTGDWLRFKLDPRSRGRE
jgi:ABC-type dipeptide/oligopeptide/nickel transport system permease subunit